MESTNDPIQPIRQLLMNIFAEEAVEPMIAMTAMVQLAAKIAYDSGKQEGLDDQLNGERWLGGCMFAFDAMTGGKLFGRPEQAAKRHLSLCSGSGPGPGLSHHQKLVRERNRAANKKARRTRRK